jgi:adenylate cyclase
MSAGPTASAPARQAYQLSPRGVSFLIVLFAFGVTLAIRHLGFLQFLEFQTYDFLIRHQTLAPNSEPIVIVELTEDDIQNPSLDWPLDDQKLAQLLLRIQAGQPSVIGLDIWRDLPVPKSGLHSNELAEVFLAHPNIIAIYTRDGIGAPPVLRDQPERIAFNDNLPPDVEVDSTIPKVRRSLLFETSKSGDTLDSLPFRLALTHLEKHGIVPAPDPANPEGMLLGKARLRPFQSNDGAYVAAHSGGWQMLLDFKCPNQFTRFPVTAVLSGKIPPVVFNDKIVIVGVNTPSVSDDRVTPTQRSHRGIELQSIIVNQLIRQAVDGHPPVRFWADWIEDAWILVWCLAAGLIGHTIRSPWISAFTALLCFAGLAATAWIAFGFGWWIPLAAPAVAFIPAGALVTSYISFREQQSREQLMKLFARQVSPDIAQALWEQRDQFLAGHRPRSQKLTATVLFTDLEGFSATSEKLDPAVLMDWLNEYMEAMANEIMAHKGVIEKYIGDAIMAVFGVPIPRTTEEELRTDARNAVRCAIAMGRQMRQLNTLWQQRGLPVCGMRIGVHTGNLVAGSLGSTERQEYTVIGDSVNTASRLESYDKDWTDPATPHPECRILISEATRIHLADEFHVTRVGTLLLKNKSEPVTIYSVIDRTGHGHGPTSPSSS